MNEHVMYGHNYFPSSPPVGITSSSVCVLASICEKQRCIIIHTYYTYQFASGDNYINISKTKNYLSRSAYLSAILAYIGLASHNCPDVVIQTPAKCDTKEQIIHTEGKIQTSRKN